MTPTPQTPETESPTTQPILSLDSPSDPASIRVRVYNAVIRRPAVKMCDITNSPPSSPSATSTLINKTSSHHSKGSIKDSRKIFVLGPCRPQYLEITDSSTTDSASSGRSLFSVKSDKSWLFKHKSISDLTSLRDRESIPLLSSPAPSIKSFDGIIYRSTSETDIDWVEYETQDEELDPFGSDQQNHEDVHNGLFRRQNRSKQGTYPADDGNDAEGYDAGKVARLLNECLESKPYPPSQTVAYRTSKKGYPNSRPTSPISPTQGIRRVMERKLSISTGNCTDTGSLASTESKGSIIGRRCCGCGRKKSIKQWMRMIPCQHIVCSSCFSATLSATTVSRGHSLCPHCHIQIHTITSLTDPIPAIPLYHSYVPVTNVYPSQAQPYHPVLRIDNVAWDITPRVVEDYLPRGVLPVDHPQPIHILLDRMDGRTKDYMYVEVADEDALKRILKHRQNSYMPGGPLTGGRKRPVTITPVSPTELLSELRPRSACELMGLLSLCHTAVLINKLVNPSEGNQPPVIAPNGVSHYVKSRHGPFYAVMSILSKLRGSTSPAYWDVFYMASGAMKALAQASFNLANVEYGMSPEAIHVKAQDDHLLEKLSLINTQDCLKTLHSFRIANFPIETIRSQILNRSFGEPDSSLTIVYPAFTLITPSYPGSSMYFPYFTSLNAMK